MPYDVRLTPEAARQFQIGAEWWEANRPSAPGLFLAEMERVFGLLGTEPGVGKPLENQEFPDYPTSACEPRALPRLLPGSRSVEVVAVWHASRGEGPPLASPG